MIIAPTFDPLTVISDITLDDLGDRLPELSSESFEKSTTSASSMTFLLSLRSALSVAIGRIQLVHVALSPEV
jgi:hypothetical protein